MTKCFKGELYKRKWGNINIKAKDSSKIEQIRLLELWENPSGIPSEDCCFPIGQKSEGNRKHPPRRERRGGANPTNPLSERKAEIS